MYFALAFLSCFAVASASICCIPPQWEATIGFITGINRNGKIHFSRGVSSMAYDALRKVVGHIEYIEIGVPGKSMQVDVLLDYATNTKYIRQGTNCIKTRLNRVWVDGCIPNNATVLATDSVLGLGTNSIPVDSYRIPFESGVEMDVSVTSSGCIPVLETFKGSLAPNEYFMENTGFINVTIGLSDPAALNSPPVSCENAPLVEAHYTQGQGNFTAGMVGRRSIFGF